MTAVAIILAVVAILALQMGERERSTAGIPRGGCKDVFLWGIALLVLLGLIAISGGL